MIPNTTFITQLFRDTVHGIFTFNIKHLSLRMQLLHMLGINTPSPWDRETHGSALAALKCTWKQQSSPQINWLSLFGHHLGLVVFPNRTPLPQTTTNRKKRSENGGQNDSRGQIIVKFGVTPVKDLNLCCTKCNFESQWMKINNTQEPRARIIEQLGTRHG